jgi:DNA-binding transcriptional ArsR family regulator
MVTDSLDPKVYGAIADPIRRGILDLLRQGERPAGDLAAHFPVSRPAVSRHLRVLRRAGLVAERKDAQLRIYSLCPEPLRDVGKWLDSYRVFWGARLHELKRYVESKHPGPATNKEGE